MWNPHDNYSKLSLTCHKSRACCNLNIWKNFDVTIGTCIVIYSKWCGFCTSRPPACPPARPKISIFCAKRLVSHHAHGPPQHSRLGLRSPTSNAITIVSGFHPVQTSLLFFLQKAISSLIELFACHIGCNKTGVEAGICHLKSCLLPIVMRPLSHEMEDVAEMLRVQRLHVCEPYSIFCPVCSLEQQAESRWKWAHYQMVRGLHGIFSSVDQ